MESILDSIGNTPLLRLRRCAPPNGAELWLKLETVVEYTGGSTGPALGLICRAKGYRALIPDPGLDRVGHAALGTRRRSTTSSRSATTRRSR
jgi:cysteine synthase